MAFVVERLASPEYLDAGECWLCDGIFDPPCPYHPDATPASVLIDGYRKWIIDLVWFQRRRSIEEAEVKL